MSSDESDPERFQEAMTEASAVMAGTMLMASGISGSGPGTYDSNTTLCNVTACDCWLPRSILC